MDSYDLVLLDADGTLYDFEAAAESAFFSSCSEFGISREGLFPRYIEINHALWTALERGEIDKERLKSERFRRLFAEKGIGVDAEAFSGRYLRGLSEGAQLLEGAEPFVRTLAASGARLAIVTNGIAEVQRGRFFRSPLADLIPELLISEELGAEKPAEAFFAEAFRRLGRAESEKTGVIVMGDSWNADIVGALGFGLDALWFNPGRAGRPQRPSASAGGRIGVLNEAATYGEALRVLGLAEV